MNEPAALARRKALVPSPARAMRGVAVSGRLARAGAGVAAVLLALCLLRATEAVCVPVIVAALLWLLLAPAAEALARRMPLGLAAALLVFVPALALGGLMALGAPAALAWLRDLGASARRLVHGLDPLAGRADTLGEAARWLQARTAWEPGAAEGWLGAHLPTAVLLGVAVLMLVFFLLLAQRSLLAGVLRALPARRARIVLLRTLADVRVGVHGYFVTMALVNLGLAIATGLTLPWFGIARPLGWTVAIFGLSFVPYVGPLLIAVLLAAASPAAGDALASAAPAAVFLLLHAVEAHFVSPWVMGDRLRLGRPALLLAVLAGGWAWGVAGGMLAVPLLIAWRALLDHAPERRVARALLAGEDGAAPSLAASMRAALQGDPALSQRACKMPIGQAQPSPCASPTSPKPTRPKSTASR